MTTETLNPKTKDNSSTCKSWILINNSSITICNQLKGESPTGCVILTIKEFEKFIKFYETYKK